MLDAPSLAGRRFLDIGSGSGLFSLAARRLGASVHSFDFDPDSVACTRALRERHVAAGGDPGGWTVEQGSVLDAAFMAKLGTFDVVYSWGVLHHTGRMHEAVTHAIARVAPGGQLFIALYNDQGAGSRRWLAVKRAYNRLPPALRWLVLAPATVRLWGKTVLLDTLKGDPTRTWRGYADRSMRGMSAWRDVVDWVGGLPFEVATPDEVVDLGARHGLRLDRLRTTMGGHGCNEFVFSRPRSTDAATAPAPAPLPAAVPSAAPAAATPLPGRS
jgi:2-polyprenyl-6-hydroxyphenyl methylase/3-demethylubiquinone-9 3-methyltransferase